MTNITLVIIVTTLQVVTQSGLAITKEHLIVITALINIMAACSTLAVSIYRLNQLEKKYDKQVEMFEDLQHSVSALQLFQERTTERDKFYLPKIDSLEKRCDYIHKNYVEKG